MKFTVQKSVLMNRLTPAMGTVSNKNTITSIEGVLIEALEGDKIRISTYDMNKGVRSTFDAVSIERTGKFIVNAQRLYQTIRVLPDDEVTIEVNDKLNCTITSPTTRFAANGTRRTKIRTSVQLFRKALRRCGLCAIILICLRVVHRRFSRAMKRICKRQTSYFPVASR